MIHADEDDEFARIERENAMKGQPYHFTRRKNEDDDIQEYVKPWVGLTKNEVETLSWIAEGNTWIAIELAEAKLKEKNT
jgi:hypothetical protein